MNRRDPDTGRTPLHVAVAAGPERDAPEIVRVLLDAGADVNATTNDGASALDISRVAAARSRRSDTGRATGNDALAVALDGGRQQAGGILNGGADRVDVTGGDQPPQSLDRHASGHAHPPLGSGGPGVGAAGSPGAQPMSRRTARKVPRIAAMRP